ncbi:MAG: hypothetical protein IAF08_09955 [Rhizobacter sp.]|nr:hypothetical protein [Chlorobiales bacterium]
MPLTKVLIAVKTYPTISTKYEELVCTAGFREDGRWIRIYPVRFRQKSFAEQYRKYEWIEIDLEKNTQDFRPESYRPHSVETEIKILGEIKPDGESWQERREVVLKKVYTDLTVLIDEAKDKSICTSLAVFKPKEILAVEVEETEREWSEEKLNTLRQYNIFETASTETKDQVVRKLPYKFSYSFLDERNRRATLMIEDWELGQLYWNCLRRHEGDEHKACRDVQNKYFEDLAKTKDLFLFLGTTKQYHYVAPNPFVIVGTFHPKHPKPETQLGLF